jgi:hypothetical protein
MLIVPASRDAAAAETKIKVTKQADLPRSSYVIVGTASQFVESTDEQFNPFASKVRADIERVLADYEIEDKSTMRQLLGAKLDLQELGGEYDAGLQTIEALRALEEKPSSKLTSGLFARARLQAAKDTGARAGAAYEQAFRKRYRESIEALPWDVVQDRIKESFAYSRINSRGATLGEVKTELDPAVLKSGTLDKVEAWELISARNNLKSAIPLSAERGDVLRGYIAQHDVVKPEIWTAREATFTKDQRLTPVLVGIWDTGVDVAQFPDQLFTDPVPSASGTHGLAFDDVGKPSKDWLYPLTPEQQKAYPEFRDEIKGILDLQNGVDSPEAAAVQKKYGSLSPDEMHERMELNKVIGCSISTERIARGSQCAAIRRRGSSLRASTINCRICRLPLRKNGLGTWAPPFNRWRIISGHDTSGWST